MPDKAIPDIQVDCVGTTVCPRCAAVVDVSALRAFETARCESCKTRFPAPGKIGQYVLLRQLSLSETGATYRAFDTSMSRHVQVNVMRRALRQDKEKVEAFLAEARALAALDSRSAARAFFVGDEDGRPYSVTELVEGPSLQAVLSGGSPIKEKRALQMGIDLVGVLASAARMGLVHGDITPGNIFITPQGKVKLMNFRFAGAGRTPPTAEAAPSDEGYASPEHLSGERIDSRSDVYSLGATLYHALTGQRPFADGRAHGRAEAPVPNAQEARSTLHRPTADILAGMLLADPDKRYGADFPDLLARLRRALKVSMTPEAPSTKPNGLVVAKLAGPAGPAPPSGPEAAAALDKLSQARRVKRKSKPAPTPAPKGSVLPLELLPWERPPAETPPRVQVLPEQAENRSGSVLPLQVDDEPDGDGPLTEQPGTDTRDKRVPVMILSIVAAAAVVLICLHAGLIGPGAESADETPSAGSSGAPSSFGGKIGLGTWQTAAEFKEVRVSASGQWLTLFESNFKKDGVKKWTRIRGEWELRGKIYRQKDEGGKDCFTVVGDPSWSDYTLTLKARKIGGREGFFIPFRWVDDKNYFMWNVGGLGNTKHVVERIKNGGKPAKVSEQVNGSIKKGQWYDIKIELKGPHITCYLNGKPINTCEVK